MGDENISETGTVGSSDLIVEQLISNKKYENWLSTLMNNAMKPEFQKLKKTVTELGKEIHGLKKEKEELQGEIDNLKVDRDEFKSDTPLTPDLKLEHDNNTYAFKKTKRHLEQPRTRCIVCGIPQGSIVGPQVFKQNEKNSKLKILDVVMENTFKSKE